MLVEIQMGYVELVRCEIIKRNEWLYDDEEIKNLWWYDDALNSHRSEDKGNNL